ncbi:MAG: hypothetical protein KAH25_07525 [Bacteroidales bacterium]|nr:hypothetical protein [Bacteroidales bacterium]
MAKFSKSQLRATCYNDINFLMRLVNPELMEHDFPDEYIAIFMLIKENIDDQSALDKLAIGLPRGLGKTVFITACLLWVCLFSKRNFIAIVTQTHKLSLNIMSTLDEYLSNDNITAIFESWEDAKTRSVLDTKESFFMGRRLFIVCVSAGGAVRGLVLYGFRPDFYFMDDIQSRENAESVEQSKKLWGWVTTTLLKGRSPKGAISIFVGNKYLGDRTIMKILESHPSWTSFIVGAILKDGSALWEKVRSRMSLLAEYVDDVMGGNADAFLTEMLNGDTQGLFSGLDIDSIPLWKEQYDSEPVIAKSLIIDIATDKRTVDQCVLMTVNFTAEFSYISRIQVGKWNHKELARKAVEQSVEDGCPLICYEDVAFQHIMNKEITDILEGANIYTTSVMPVSPKGESKNSRIINLFFKLLMSGHIKLTNETFGICVGQISTFNASRTDNLDDIIDTAGYISQIRSNDEYMELARTTHSSLMLGHDKTQRVNEMNTEF